MNLIKSIAKEYNQTIVMVTHDRRLAEYADRGNEEAFVKCNGMECCECGCCSFVCPAKRNLTQSIKSMRKTVLGKRKK